ncbi:MAG TPA: RDD family protein [Pseudonocardia sp.]|nr:RDD family protein [Pseudonocardia sp.]
MSDLVTGDAVVLELRVAKLASRAVAFAIDVAVMVTAFGLLLLVAADAVGALDDALSAAVGLVILIAIFVAYPVTVETLSRGRSLGKLAMGLRVVRADGGPIRFRQALTRGLAGFIVDFGVLSLFTGAIGLISSLASPRGRRVGDVLADTVVVRERAPVSEVAPVPMPPPLAGWAGLLELSRLPAGPAADARRFLARVHDLDPTVRNAMAHSLAARIAAHVGPAPPPGTPPEAYLAAVLAERRRREEARLAREGSRHAGPGGPDPAAAWGAPTPRPAWGAATGNGGPAEAGATGPAWGAAAAPEARGAAPPAADGFTPPA